MHTLHTRIHAGHSLALLGSALLLIAASGLFMTFGLTLLLTLGDTNLDAIPASPLPALVYLTWAGFVGGCTASIIALALYGFRARWFWRCLIAASVLWLLAPPFGTVIGLVSLVVLIATRKAFPLGAEPETAPL